MISQPQLQDLLRPATGQVPVFSHRTYEGNQIVNPQRSAIFENCSFRRVTFEAARGSRATLAASEFLNCQLTDCSFGPATLDMRGTCFTGCSLTRVTFMLGKLSRADFTGAKLVDVYFRRADLAEASFRNTTLQRVSFERATLLKADFAGCKLLQGDFWGEPPWNGAIVADEVRYSFAILERPVARVEQLLQSSSYSSSEREQLAKLRDWLLGWAADRPQLALSYHELETLFDRSTFIWLLKQLRGDA